MPSFSDLLKQGREKKKLTQEELAEALDMSQAAISAWENDAGYPSLPVTVRLLKLVKLDLTKIDHFIKEPKKRVPKKKRNH